MGLALGDYDSDGLVDVFVSSIYQTEQCEVAHNEEEICAHWGISGNRLFRNRGDRTFEDTTDEAGVRDGRWGWGASFLDFDNDGLLDLAQAAGQFYPYPDFRADNFFEDPSFLWKNLDGKSFLAVSERAGLDSVRRGKGLVVFDHDKNGFLDLFVVQNSDRPRLFQNQGGGRASGTWLVVEPRGAGAAEGGSNRGGIGAIVRVRTAEGKAWVKELVGGSSFLGQNEPVLHFGLGTAEVVDLEVYWPRSGCRQEVENVRTGSRLVVSEQDCPRGQALP